MKKLFIIFTFLLTILTVSMVYGQTQTSGDKEMVIKASRFLEEKPFDKQSKEIRARALVYAMETKDVTVIVCGTGTPFLDKKIKFGSELLGQYMISMTAFKLENPDKANDENAAQLAGIESTLKAYEAMVKENPKAKADKVETLLAKRNDGTLAKYVADADCGKK